ncbi:MAG: protoporphyrinogen oxidase [Pirellulaceae bacterium]|nr:protoporphyrinogen oxidase [Pirellulaceae bacterium]
MPSSPPSSPRIAIIGGGITGLAAAHRLLERSPAAQVTLFEASGRLGGVLLTERRDGYLMERSADMFTTREPWALDLCRRVGIDGELIETNKQHRRAFVVHKGKLVPVPEGFTLMRPAKVWPILKTPLLSPLGKLRLAWEYFTPRKNDTADESLESFATRRFGREAFDRLIQPLIGGIYTADPSLLSMQATLPQFVEMERKAGSLIAGVRSHGSGVSGQKAVGSRQESGARYGMFLTPREGMQRLVDGVAAKLPAGVVRLNAKVEQLKRSAEGRKWRLQIATEEPQEFDAVILAAPSSISGKLLESFDSELAGLVGSIPQAGCNVALLGYRREQIAHPLDGFGFVVPTIEKRKIIAGSFSSVKFPGRAPDGKVLLRVFIGGALQPELLSLSDAETTTLVLDELRDLLGVRGEPEFCEIAPWHGAMPQYHVGHLDKVRQIEERVAAIPGLALAGNSYHGVGVPFCIHDGEQAAERVLSTLVL